jgi:UDP-3-O-[3-hydroxymyristoyl] N-acetylglucosamine deacetylase
MPKLSVLPPPEVLHLARTLAHSKATPLASVEGTGLISGQRFKVALFAAPKGQGIHFLLPNERVLPAKLQAVVHAKRGVTLGHSSGATLSIVEHFLGATVLCGVEDLNVHIQPLAPLPAPERFELPLLDGSAQGWVDLLKALPSGLRSGLERPWQELSHAVTLPGLSEAPTPQPVAPTNPMHGPMLYALPKPSLQPPSLRLTYGLNFPHPLTQHQYAVWDSAVDAPCLLSEARTFGFTQDLPQLQAQGLALGASIDNTLGLNEDGSTTTPLRSSQEPLYHKMLDLLGDCRLAGINLLRVNAHVLALHAGHESHLAFAQALKPKLFPQ